MGQARRVLHHWTDPQSLKGGILRECRDEYILVQEAGGGQESPKDSNTEYRRKGKNQIENQTHFIVVVIMFTVSHFSLPTEAFSNAWSPHDDPREKSLPHEFYHDTSTHILPVKVTWVALGQERQALVCGWDWLLGWAEAKAPLGVMVSLQCEEDLNHLMNTGNWTRGLLRSRTSATQDALSQRNPEA